MKADPDTSWLLESPAQNIWVGEGRHVMTYSIASGKSFNMVLSHTDRTDASTWSERDAIKDMRREFASWDPRFVHPFSKSYTNYSTTNIIHLQARKSNQPRHQHSQMAPANRRPPTDLAFPLLKPPPAHRRCRTRDAALHEPRRRYGDRGRCCSG